MGKSKTHMYNISTPEYGFSLDCSAETPTHLARRNATCQLHPHHTPPRRPHTMFRSTVRHAYPRSVPGVSDDWFAEHMLPEGAHNHALDWTVMFLNRDKIGLDEDWPVQIDGGGGDSDRGTSKVRGGRCRRRYDAAVQRVY